MNTDVEIVENKKEYLDEFIRLNEQWISHYFEIEDADRALSANPTKVIENGGYIFSLLENNCVLGVCALFNDGDGIYELARMAVDPEAQGKGYGDILIEKALSKLEEINASKVYLVSNTKLKPAISLYEKHGFITTLLGQHPEYNRANIVMEKILAT